MGVLTGLVESDVAVLADPAQKQLDPTERLDSVFVGFAFGVEVFDGAVEDVHLSRGDIDYTRSVVRRQSASRAQGADGVLTVREEFPEHERVVRFGMVFGEPDVFVHVERDDMLEPALGSQTGSGCCTRRGSRKLPVLDEFDQGSVGGDRR